jgi:molecular chaperone HscA
MLLQIHEPGQTPTPHEEENDVAVGIDLGTTHSLVTIVTDGKAEVLSNKEGKTLYPSVVAYDQEHRAVTGEDALKGQAPIRSIKRLMGRGYSDIKKVSGQYPYQLMQTDQEEMVRLDVHGRAVTPVEISAEILKSLKQQAEVALGKPVTKAVITVPAYFDDAARGATKDAAKVAGLEVLRLVNEPTAAALAYGLDKKAEGIFAVYDLGGGTFDISILKMEKGVFQVLATGGSTVIGGDDFDREVAELILWDYKNQTGKASSEALDMHSLLTQARQIKEYLTDYESGEFGVTIDGYSFTVSMDRTRLNQAIQAYVNATVDLVVGALNDANVELDQIKGVVMVGGATRTPLVQEAVEEFFGKRVFNDVNPDEVVACGAALQADGLVNGSDNLLLDVLPLSLGIETMGGIVEKIIFRNTPIPVAKAQEFTTYKDGQTGLMVHAVQGEREMVSQNRSLAKFELKGIPPMTAGAARIKVTFAVDADGLLRVSAQEETTGVRQEVEVKPSYGLSDKEIEGMLRDSMANAKEDMNLRLLTESKVEAQQLLEALDAAIEKDPDLLTPQQKDQIDFTVDTLKEKLIYEDREAIIQWRKTLEEQTQEFAGRRMDKYIKLALQGEQI